MPQGTETIPTITVAEAVKILRGMGMRLEDTTLQFGIKQAVFPFGIAIECDKQWRYIIFERQFKEWISERSVIDDFGNWTPPQ